VVVGAVIVGKRSLISASILWGVENGRAVFLFLLAGDSSCKAPLPLPLSRWERRPYFMGGRSPNVRF
jgi:hypothetical protein